MNRVKKFFRRLGPGFITGASDDDPSGIATYAQTGVQFGYSQLWLALFSTPFMITIQEMCGRIGLVKGKGLAMVLKERFGKRILYAAVALLLIANTVNIGADLGAMASSMQMIAGLPFVFWLIVMVVVILVLEIFVSYKTYVKYLKYFTLSLFAYIVTVFIVKQDWLKILSSTFVPNISITKDYLFNIVAIFGTTISPYLFFWQASEETEEEVAENKLKEIDAGSPRITMRDVKKMRFDTNAGMIFSNLITFFIIITIASTLGRSGILNVQTANEAAEALRPIAGNFAGIVFALGIIGTGLLSVPILAGSASYAIAETLGWRSGLYRKFNDAHGFYGVITIATLVGLLVNFTPIKPFQMLYYTAVLNGILAPPLMVLILVAAGDKKLMGRYVNSKFSQGMGWLVTVVMGVCAIALLVSFFV